MAILWLEMADAKPKKDTRFKKGTAVAQGAGRPKGSPNRTTVAVKEALQQAFDGVGGVEALTKFAKSDPDAFYKLWVKMLPQEVRASVAFSPELIAQIQEGRKRVGD